MAEDQGRAGVAGSFRVEHALQAATPYWAFGERAAFRAPCALTVVIGGSFELQHPGLTFEGRPLIASLNLGFARRTVDNSYTQASLDVFGEGHWRECGALPGYSFNVVEGDDVFLGFLVETAAEAVEGARLVATFAYVGV